MVLSPIQRWAAALWVERNHGDNGLDHITFEVERLTSEGDDFGVAAWKDIEACYRQLRDKKRVN